MRDEIETYTEHNIRPFGVNPASAEEPCRLRRSGWGCRFLCSPIRAWRSVARTARSSRFCTGIARSVCLIDRDGTVLYSQAGAPGASIILESLGSS